MRSQFRSNRLLPACLAMLAIASVPLPALAQAFTGWSDKQQEKRVKQFEKLTPEYFEKNVSVRDDDLEVIATIDTEKGYRFKGGFSDPVRANTFLRTLINKQTGHTTHQLYASFTYSGEWRFFDGATYATSEGPVAASLSILQRDVDCTYGCVFTEIVAFEVPESVLRELAQSANTRPVKPWKFRFKAQRGLDWTDDIAPAEAAGLLMAVDRYRAERSSQ